MILPSRLRQHASAAGWCTCAIALILMMLMSGTPSAQAQDDAGKVLKAMTNYVTSQKVISATYDTDIEIVTITYKRRGRSSSCRAARGCDPPLDRAMNYCLLAERRSAKLAVQVANLTAGGLICHQLKAQKNDLPTEKEKLAINFLRNDLQARVAFINKIAAPVLNKMFECGLIP